VVVPGALHVFDVIRYRGRIYASAGSLPPDNDRAPASPAALHGLSDDGSRFDYEVGFPDPAPPGSWRFTYLTRFRDRLYASFEALQTGVPIEFVIYQPPADATTLEPDHARAFVVTEYGGASTLRWFTDKGRLFWIAYGADGVHLRVSSDGEHFETVALPPEAGRPTDLTRFRGALVLLCERALLRLHEGKVSWLARVTEEKSPFEISDGYCAAPLAVFQNGLYAGGQRRGALYRLVPADDAG
jgi:hypothetical protein